MSDLTAEEQIAEMVAARLRWDVHLNGMLKLPILDYEPFESDDPAKIKFWSHDLSNGDWIRIERWRGPMREMVADYMVSIPVNPEWIAAREAGEKYPDVPAWLPAKFILQEQHVCV